MCYLMPKQMKEVVIAQMEFKLTYYDALFQHTNHHIMVKPIMNYLH